MARVRLSQSGVHWFDRETGLNVLLDDVQVPERLWHRAPRFVSIALTNSCGLRCRYCYAPKHKDSLLAHSVLQWAAELDGAGGLGVGFGGGEPTDHPDFASICLDIARSTDLAVGFTTHGHGLTPALVQVLGGSINFLRISVDGVGATYERLRGRSFTDLQAAVCMARDISDFGINTVVNDETIHELDNIAAFAINNGASELLLLPQQPTRRAPGIDVVTQQRLMAWLDRRPSCLRVAVSAMGVEPGMSVATPFPAEPEMAGHLHIDASAILRPSAFSTAGVPVGGSLLDAIQQLELARA
jgi:sulfatase maturation enzyme AslB (radical SAM superfamily)